MSTDPVVERALRLAAALGLHASSGEVLQGGNSNDTVRVRGDDGDLVVRVARDPGGDLVDPFDVEAWCARSSGRAGLPTPKVVVRGHVGDDSVLVHRFVPGRPADADDLAAWHAIGRAAAALGQVPVADAPDALFSRFGRDLDRAWQQHLAYNRGALSEDDPLIGLRVYAEQERAALIAVVDRTAGHRLHQGLVHGDLSTRNLLATEDGYVVVDWGAAHAGPSPWTDLERIRRWAVTDDPDTRVPPGAWAAVLRGSGLEPEEADAVLRDLSVLHALDVVRWAIDRKPDRLQQLTAESAATVRRELRGDG